MFTLQYHFLCAGEDLTDIITMGTVCGHIRPISLGIVREMGSI